MNKKVGLWIDHRQAIVVTLNDTGESTHHILSEVEKHAERSSTAEDSGAFEALKVKADDTRQKAFSGHLNTYYDAVIATVADAEGILIFGPGEAKSELKRRLEEKKLASRIVGVEAADQMTEPQIVSKAKKYFVR